MEPDLHRYLDGEIGREELSHDLRREAGAWEGMLAAFREAREPSPPPELHGRVMSAVRRQTDRLPGWRAAWAWLTRPRTVRVSPLAGALATAALLLIVWVAPWEPSGEPPAAPFAGSRGGTTVSADRQSEPALVSVQFTLRAPEARSVAVAGDFSGWEPAARLQDPDGDGVWTGRVTLRAGIHEYMFVVDGARWVTDPEAESYVSDGFGHRNAVLALSTRGS